MVAPPASSLHRTADRRFASRHPLGDLEIVVQIYAHRRLRRVWRPGVAAEVAVTHASVSRRGRIRLTGRDLRTGFIVVMKVRGHTDRVTVTGIRALHERRMRRRAWRFRGLDPRFLPPILDRLARVSTPPPGQGAWDLPKRRPGAVAA